MSKYDYEKSKEIEAGGYPFYAVIMAAMKQSDSDNAERLKIAFPATWMELERRYNAPGAVLPEDQQAAQEN